MAFSLAKRPNAAMDAEYDNIILKEY